MVKNILLIFLIFITYAQASSHHPQQFLQEIAGKPTEGKEIYQHYCANCHAEKPIIRLGAPRVGVLADWKPRVKNGYAEMIKHTDEGYNAMPARGGCFECSDQQLLKALEYMLPKKLKKGLISEH